METLNGQARRHSEREATGGRMPPRQEGRDGPRAAPPRLRAGLWRVWLGPPLLAGDPLLSWVGSVLTTAGEPPSLGTDETVGH